MPKLTDLTGSKFGRLIVLRRVNNSKSGKLQWLCQCRCGNTKIITGYHLKSGATKSCSCLSREKTIRRNMSGVQHGHCRGRPSKVYEVWHGIIGRCTNFKDKRYNNYGGRGITVCKQWMKFENFLEDMGEVPKGYQIDRIDNDKGYCRKNCRWTTAKLNSRNKRNNHLETYNDKTRTLVEWAEELKMNYSTLLNRITRGWTIEEAFMTPVRKKRKR